MADQISDAVLDAMLAEDPDSRVACETLIKTGIVVVAGEVRSKAHVDINALVKEAIADIDYGDPSSGHDLETEHSDLRGSAPAARLGSNPAWTISSWQTALEKMGIVIALATTIKHRVRNPSIRCEPSAT